MKDARILVIDNYDSFTFNLVQALRGLEAETLVHRNDELDVEEALALEPTHLLISPGPGTPERAGNSMAIIQAFLQRVPILGVCLGHQALAAVFGARIERAERPIHGKAERIFHDGRGLYRGLPNPLEVGRYHSLIVAEKGLPSELSVSSYTRAGEIMGIRHTELPHEGLQFHPESVLTPLGIRMLERFLMRPPVARTATPPARQETPA
jgi:anthranilate synthase component 2/para-aminobenzoate synthetase component 2